VSSYSSIQNPLVLVADDSRTILAMVSSRLERAGYEVVGVSNGDDALAVAEQRLPALVILDVEMPTLDGLEVTRRLRANEATREIPIVLLTGHTEADEVEAGQAAGATAYITKPFSPQELEARVEDILGRR
jgi:two-component system alkaline phosphatase synthesis response regulator PhoP